MLRPGGVLLGWFMNPDRFIFTLIHLVQAPHHADAAARYMPSYFATHAIRPEPGPQAGYLPWTAYWVSNPMDDPAWAGQAQNRCDKNWRR